MSARVQQFEQAMQPHEKWLPLTDKNLEWSPERKTLDFIGKGSDPSGKFFLCFKHFAESDTAETHKSVGISEFMTRHEFERLWPELYFWLMWGEE